jgi:hypothetical protein
MYVPVFYIVFSFTEPKLQRIVRNNMREVRGKNRKVKEERTFYRISPRPSRWCYRHITLPSMQTGKSEYARMIWELQFIFVSLGILSG